MLLWATLALAVDGVRFVLLTPEAYTGIDAVAVLSRLFGALVLLLFPIDRLGPRLRWIAGGFLVLGLGGLLFGFVWPLLFSELAPETSMFASIVVWSIAGLMFVMALLPFPLSRNARRLLVSAFSSVLVLGTLTLAALDALPTLVTVTSFELTELRSDAPLRGLTTWHWVVSSFPLLLALLATACALYFYLRDELGGWLVAAMVLLAGSQLHNLFWPSAYSPVLTTADVLRLLFAAVVVTGGVLELRRVAREREWLLSVERDYSAKLAELGILKNNFTAMVAHELHSPLAAVRSLSTVLTYQDLEPEQRRQAVESIQRQIDLLTILVEDVRDISAVERSSFDVAPHPTSLGRILSDIDLYGRALPGQRPIAVHGPFHVPVLADRERIGQVLRNLLSNAVKYSPDGTPIDVRASVRGERVLFAVEDRGFGIAEADRERVFECYARGSDPRASMVRGAGLGLYLSRHIVRAHGSDLLVTSEPGEGSTFSFELEIAR
jgi:signal transduction histidine kinase